MFKRHGNEEFERMQGGGSIIKQISNAVIPKRSIYFLCYFVLFCGGRCLKIELDTGIKKHQQNEVQNYADHRMNLRQNHLSSPSTYK